MERLRFIEHRGVKVLFMDCASNTKDEAYQIFDDFDALVRRQPPKSVRLLCDFENCYHDTTILGRWKDAAKEQEAFVLKTACLGIGGTFRIAMAGYRFFARFRGVDVSAIMRNFDSPEEAKDWLIEP